MSTNRLAALAGLFLFVLASCTSQQTRAPIAASFVTPTAEELFIVGRFQVKKDPLKFLDEDHYGQELDLSRRRPAVDLRGTIFEQKYGAEGTKLVGNFYHRGQFYIVRVPDRAVKNVYFVLSYLPPKSSSYSAVHSLLRFELETPIQLIAPMPTQAQLLELSRAAPAEEIKALPEPLDGPESLVRNVVISAEAQWVKDDKYSDYNSKRGMLGAFTQVVRFESMQTRFEEFYDSGHPATQVKFEPLGEKSGDAILAEALRTSEKDGLSKLFDTFWYGCTIVAFEIVERAEGTKDQRLSSIRGFMQMRVPVLAPSKLAEYGGIEAIPMDQDPTLLDDSEEAYQDKIAMPKRDLCPDEFETDNCTQVKSAVAALKTAGRI